MHLIRGLFNQSKLDNVEYGETLTSCLPDEIILTIFSYLGPISSLDQMKKICRRWKRIAKTPDLYSCPVKIDQPITLTENSRFASFGPNSLLQIICQGRENYHTLNKNGSFSHSLQILDGKDRHYHCFGYGRYYITGEHYPFRGYKIYLAKVVKGQLEVTHETFDYIFNRIFFFPVNESSFLAYHGSTIGSYSIDSKNIICKLKREHLWRYNRRKFDFPLKNSYSEKMKLVGSNLWVMNGLGLLCLNPKTFDYKPVNRHLPKSIKKKLSKKNPRFDLLVRKKDQSAFLPFCRLKYDKVVEICSLNDGKTVTTLNCETLSDPLIAFDRRGNYAAYEGGDHWMIHIKSPYEKEWKIQTHSFLPLKNIVLVQNVFVALYCAKRSNNWLLQIVQYL